VDVVTRLREGELRPLRLQADDGLHASAFKSLYERGEGQELVRQQYTGRYPFELLQNANDAARDAGERGRAHFVLTESALIVADNGFGFGDEQVDAICSLGRSSKGPGEAVANLKAFLLEHTGNFGDGVLLPDDNVQRLLDFWFEKMGSAEGRPSSETLGHYRSHVRWVLDSDKTEHPLGAYQLRHVRPVIIQAALDSSCVSADMRKRIQSVLVRAFDLAIFHDAINGNPATTVPSVPVPRRRRSRSPPRISIRYAQSSASGRMQRSAQDPRASTFPTSSRCSSPPACVSGNCWPCDGPISN
jgi:hypothetical protein